MRHIYRPGPHGSERYDILEWPSLTEIAGGSFKACEAAARLLEIKPVMANVRYGRPGFQQVISFLAKDIEQRPETLKSLSADFAARMESLVKGTKVELDEPIDGDVDL